MSGGSDESILGHTGQGSRAILLIPGDVPLSRDT